MLLETWMFLPLGEWLLLQSGLAWMHYLFMVRRVALHSTIHNLGIPSIPQRLEQVVQDLPHIAVCLNCSSKTLRMVVDVFHYALKARTWEGNRGGVK